MAKRSDFKRRKNDTYDTPVKGMEALLPHLDRKTKFIEPCAGDNRMVEFFEKHGHICIDGFDIAPRSNEVKEMDAFDYSPLKYAQADYIITNPPWTRQILHPMIDLFAGIRPTWLLFDGDWAFTKQASPYLEKCVKIVALPRLKWIEGSQYSAKDNCAWYLFCESHNGPTEFIGR